MDISNIHIVGQWRATCNLSTIWQRWGRAARDRNLQGTVVLFAEKDYFDDVREEKCQRQEARKRKAKRPLNTHAPASKRRICTSGNGIAAVPVPATRLEGTGGHFDVESSDEENEGGLSNVEEQAVAMGTKDAADGSKGAGEVEKESELREMMKSKSDKKPLKTWRKRKELDPAMNFLINAHLRPGFHCRRKVFDLHFNNATAGERSHS